jgi:transglutaminase-like putative cysteine protease
MSSVPRSAPHSGYISMATAIDRYFIVSLYLLVLMGFGTLAATGGLDLATVLLVGGALAFRGYLLTKRQNFAIPDRWTTPLTILYFVFYASDYFLLSRSFLTATVHLVLFAVVIRMFSLRRERDYTMLAVLAFLMVLASAVLTVDSVFLFFFAAFLLTAVATFVLMEMRRSARSAQIQARHSSDPQEHRHLAFSLARLAPALVLMTLLGATVVFFLLPRMSAGYLGSYSFGTDLSTGFSDRVQLGRIGQIQQSNAVVMHIQIDGDPQGRYDLYWRGIALGVFDGSSWSSPREQYGLGRRTDGSFAVPAFGTGSTTANAAQSSLLVPKPSRMIHYRVLMEPIGTNVFFLAPWARSVSGPYRMLSADSGAAVYNLDNQHPITRYEADSDLSAPSATDLRAAQQDYPAQLAPVYLRLPPQLDPRIPKLASQIAGSASNNYDKAARVESYLKTHFGYTLQLPQAPVKDPLADFLFERKQGHCEYFSSSMAVMLRSLGIPSRVVNGFRSDEFNDLTENYVVRAKDAHSWVEAYFPGYGWVHFDPTPAGSAGIPQGWGRVMLYLDAASSFWREWVISYDSAHQSVLGQETLSGSRRLWERSREWTRSRYVSMLDWLRHRQEQVEHSPGRWGGMVFGMLALFAILGNAGRISRMIRAWHLRAYPEQSPELAAAMWYQRMARSLARCGLRKSTAQTPEEFIRVIGDEQLRQRVARFTEAYELARFGNSTDDARRLSELYEEVESETRR